MHNNKKRAPRQCQGRERTRKAWVKGNLDANRQERIIRSDVISALRQNRPIMPDKNVWADQKQVEAFKTACFTAGPCLGGV
jgi:hypothetical protein